jgi:hypothetical protein
VSNAIVKEKILEDLSYAEGKKEMIKLPMKRWL